MRTHFIGKVYQDKLEADESVAAKKKSIEEWWSTGPVEICQMAWAFLPPLAEWKISNERIREFLKGATSQIVCDINRDGNLLAMAVENRLLVIAIQQGYSKLFEIMGSADATQSSETAFKADIEDYKIASDHCILVRCKTIAGYHWFEVDPFNIEESGWINRIAIPGIDPTQLVDVEVIDESNIIAIPLHQPAVFCKQDYGNKWIITRTAPPEFDSAFFGLEDNSPVYFSSDLFFLIHPEISGIINKFDKGKPSILMRTNPKHPNKIMPARFLSLVKWSKTEMLICYQSIEGTTCAIVFDVFKEQTTQEAKSGLKGVAIARIGPDIITAPAKQNPIIVSDSEQYYVYNWGSLAMTYKAKRRALIPIPSETEASFIELSSGGYLTKMTQEQCHEGMIIDEEKKKHKLALKAF